MLWIKSGIILILFVGIIPLICGLPFYDLLENKGVLSKIFFSYVTGFLLTLALFEIICVPMTYARKPFTDFVFIYTVILVIIAFIVLIKKVKAFFEKGGGHIDLLVKQKSNDKSFYEIIYLSFFLIVVCIQIYGCLHYSVTYSSLDDAEYLPYATDAVTNNQMYTINPATGLYCDIDLHRAFQSFLLYFGYISKLTHISVPILAHTVFCIIFVVMSYMVYWIMAECIFDKKENRFVFLFFLALIFMFGNYSNYSLTFRLLGPNWQGKAILACILMPLLYVIFSSLVKKMYSHKFGALIMIISVASISLTLMGVGNVMVFLIVTITILAIAKKNAKILLYILWGGVFPAIVGTLYLLDRM